MPGTDPHSESKMSEESPDENEDTSKSQKRNWAENPSGLFERDDRIWKNKGLLKVGYVPEIERIVGRTEEIEKVAGQLTDLVHGDVSDHTLITGKPGTGKSLVARYVVELAKDVASDIEIASEYVNCSVDNTETQAVSTIARSFNDPEETGIDIPETGLSTSRYYKLLWEIVDEQYDSVIVILDEVDKLGNDNILMKLSRARETGRIDCRFGMIVISNKFRYQESLDERTRSTFQYEQLYFDPYDAGDLSDILERRRDAFKDGVLDEGAISLTSALSARDHGDARKAVRMLANAGDIAEDRLGPDDEAKIREEHVRAAQERAQKERLRDEIANQPMQLKLALLALAFLSMEKSASRFRTTEVHDRYSEICESEGIEQQVVRSFRNQLKDLAVFGIVESVHRSEGRNGHSLFHQLLEDPQVAIEVVYEDERLGIYED
jgi:cell division control protein 6